MLIPSAMLLVAGATVAHAHAHSTLSSPDDDKPHHGFPPQITLSPDLETAITARLPFLTHDHVSSLSFLAVKICDDSHQSAYRVFCEGPSAWLCDDKTATVTAGPTSYRIVDTAVCGPRSNLRTRTCDFRGPSDLATRATCDETISWVGTDSSSTTIMRHDDDCLPPLLTISLISTTSVGSCTVPSASASVSVSATTAEAESWTTVGSEATHVSATHVDETRFLSEIDVVVTTSTGTGSEGVSGTLSATAGTASPAVDAASAGMPCAAAVVLFMAGVAAFIYI